MVGLDRRALKIAWTVFVFALIVAFLYAIRSALITFTLSIFLALLLSPLVAFIDRFTPAKVPRTAALAIVYIALIALAVAILVPIGSAVADDAKALAAKLPGAVEGDPLSKIPLPASLEPIRERIAAGLRGRLDQIAHDALPLIAQAAGGVINGLTALIGVILIPILAFMFIKDGKLIRDEIVHSVTADRRPVIAGIFSDLRRLLAQYLRALLTIASVTFIVYSIMLALTGSRYAILLGGLAALLEFIPAVGPFIGAVTIIGVCAFSGYSEWLALLVFLPVYRLALDYGLQPVLMANGVQLHPLLVIFGALAGGEIGGIPGIFFSVPVMAALRVIFQRLRHRAAHETKTENAAAGLTV